ncbi:helix-turn-helix transcriptional regulator [Actinoplanes sp. NPDC051470]|uniref:helix-turn-helix domain-containing protein n=1 Tax=Actinoplanes sp. NPDC051470 TaxID=3157224 RepID=UPI003424C6A1
MSDVPSTGPVAAFCAELKELSRAAGRKPAALAATLSMSRGQLYAIINGEVKRPPDFARFVEPFVRACGGDDAAVAQWRRRHDVMVRVYDELRRHQPVPQPSPSPSSSPDMEPPPYAAPRRWPLVVVTLVVAVLLSAVAGVVSAHLAAPSAGPVAAPASTAPVPCAGAVPPVGADLIDATHGPADTAQHAPDWWSNTDRVRALTFDRHRWDASVEEGSKEPYDVLVVHSCVSIVTARKYRLSFRASADRAETIWVRVQDNQPPTFAASLYERIPLGATARSWSFDFIGTVTTPAGELMFQLGGRPEMKVEVSDIRLVAVQG